METILNLDFQDAPLSPVFANLGDNGLELRASSSAGLDSSCDVDIFKYFINEEELEVSSESGSGSGSPQYESLNSSPPPVPSPPEFELSPSPQTNSSIIYIPTNIKLEMGYDSGSDNKKRKIKDEGTPSPVRVHMPPIIPKTLEPSSTFPFNRLGSSSSPAPVEEDRHVKRQRRLIKNRESAQLSRMRKKFYIDDLEKKVSVLTQDNDNLTKRVASLVQDNSRLTEQVNNLTNMLKQNQSQRRAAVTNGAATNKNLKTAGVCMLMILFSFGLFFNIKGGERYREQYHVGRMLASIEEDQTPALSTSTGTSSTGSILSEEQSGAIIPKHNLPRKRSSEEVFESKAAVTKNKGADPASPRRKVIKIQTKNHDMQGKKLGLGGMGSTDIEVGERSGEEVGLVPISQAPGPISTSGTVLGLSAQFTQSIVRRADTNYIYCSQPQNVFAGEGDSHSHSHNGRDRSSVPTLISLLMPASNLNATFAGSGYGGPREEENGHALLEITCQIMNINVYPSIPLASNTSQTVS